MTNFRIVRTNQEVEELDAETVLLDSRDHVVSPIQILLAPRIEALPAVVIASGAQVRAAREAMEKEHD